jgi:hypothetical protein
VHISLQFRDIVNFRKVLSLSNSEGDAFIPYANAAKCPIEVYLSTYIWNYAEEAGLLEVGHVMPQSTSPPTIDSLYTFCQDLAETDKLCGSPVFSGDRSKSLPSATVYDQSVRAWFREMLPDRSILATPEDPGLPFMFRVRQQVHLRIRKEGIEDQR